MRRVSSSQRSDALFGQDTDPDSCAGYAGNVAWVTWRLLGEKTLLAPMHGDSLPVKWQDPPGDYMPRGRWEPREAWVVEGISKLPEYAYSRRVIYLDKESYTPPTARFRALALPESRAGTWTSVRRKAPSKALSR